MMAMGKVDIETPHPALFGKTVTKASKRNIQHSQGSSSQRMISCIPIIHTTSMVYDAFYRLWKILIYLFSKSIFISCIENWPIRHILKWQFPFLNVIKIFFKHNSQFAWEYLFASKKLTTTLHTLLIFNIKLINKSQNHISPLSFFGLVMLNMSCLFLLI